MILDYRLSGGTMISRIVIFMFIAVLALPSAILPQPAEPNPLPWGDAAVEAKGKKHKKARKPKFKTVRQEVTRTFSSTDPIVIPVVPDADNAPASPYPATIEVSGFTHGVITDVNLIFDDLTHAYPRDIDVLLSKSDGRHAMVLSDVGSVPATDIDFILDDEAATSVPDGPWTNGTFRPTEAGDDEDPYVAPAPIPDGSVALSTFDGADPNGVWQVWVVDDGSGDNGDLAGWALEITAEVEEKVKHKKKHKKGKK
jgi:subtilisin-like proprotein convertase family protein